MEKRNIREELMSIGGSEFENWYAGLSREEKLEYAFIIEKEKETYVFDDKTFDFEFLKALEYWVEQKGFLDLETPEEQIWEFFKKNKNNEKN